MTKKSMQLLAVPALLAIVFAILSFTGKDKDIVNGGGIAGENSTHFNFTAVENDPGITGHFTWGEDNYDVRCVYVNGSTATIYLSQGNVEYAVNVIDSKDGDQITAPYTYSFVDCDEPATGGGLLNVTEGNLTVHK